MAQLFFAKGRLIVIRAKLQRTHIAFRAAVQANMGPARAHVFILYFFNYRAAVKGYEHVAVMRGLGMHIAGQRPNAQQLGVLAFAAGYFRLIEKHVVLMGIGFVTVRGNYFVPAAVQLFRAGDDVAVPAFVVGLGIECGCAHIQRAGSDNDGLFVHWYLLLLPFAAK